MHSCLNKYVSHSAGPVVSIDAGWVPVLLRLSKPLWRQLIHLFISLLRLRINSRTHSLGSVFGGDFCFLDKRLLQLRWLRIKPVIILPLFLHHDFFIKCYCDSAEEGEELHVSYIVEQQLLPWLVHKINLGDLESCGNHEYHCCVALVLFKRLCF